MTKILISLYSEDPEGVTSTSHFQYESASDYEQTVNEAFDLLPYTDGISGFDIVNLSEVPALIQENRIKIETSESRRKKTTQGAR